MIELSTEARKNKWHTYEFRFKPVHKWTPRCGVQEGSDMWVWNERKRTLGRCWGNITTEVEVMPGKDGGSEPS